MEKLRPVVYDQLRKGTHQSTVRSIDAACYWRSIYRAIGQALAVETK